jgi:hypothetical protein
VNINFYCVFACYIMVYIGDGIFVYRLSSRYQTDVTHVTDSLTYIATVFFVVAVIMSDEQFCPQSGDFYSNY